MGILFKSLNSFRDLIRERTKAGLEAARARGRKGGRRQEMTKEAEQKAILAETYYREGKMGVNKIAEKVGISKMTLYKYLRGCLNLCSTSFS